MALAPVVQERARLPRREDDVEQLQTRSRLTEAAAARELGTSASRLSTYSNGWVTPSAAFMVPLRRLADAPPRKPSP